MENKIIIPLDLDYKEALKLAKLLDPKICRMKIGNQLFTSSGPKVVKELHQLGFDVFLDLKFHDIPNTVHEAVKSAADLGVWMVNVHASGGKQMLEASRKALQQFSNPPLLIAVTVLTSLSQEFLSEIGLDDLDDQVFRLTRMAKESGLDGVVCSASDAESVKKEFGEEFLTVTPGIRPSGSSLDDQSRVSTPSEAIASGSDYLVIGRPITGSEDPKKALEAIYKEIS
jgi:orotidine-5'-phosphate decarboxylase